MMTQKSFPVFATLMSALGVMILCSLGTWQLIRLDWKRGIERDLAAAYEAGSGAALDVQALPNFSYGAAQGVFVPEAAFLLSPRVLDKQVGASLMIPLQSPQGLLLVNMGWTDLPFEEIALPRSDIAVTVTGLARKPYWNSFTPENDPARGLWYRPNLLQVEDVFDIGPFLPYIFYAQQLDGLELAGFPRNPERWAPVNNHAGYAAFWFSMAAILLLIYYIRFWRKQTQ